MEQQTNENKTLDDVGCHDGWMAQPTTAGRNDYLMEENNILRDELLNATGKKRILLSDAQRRRLATLARE